MDVAAVCNKMTRRVSRWLWKAPRPGPLPLAVDVSVDVAVTVVAGLAAGVVLTRTDSVSPRLVPTEATPLARDTLSACR